MSYDLDQFVSDCRAILKRNPGRDGREEVRLRLERLLSNRDFVETYCGEHVPRGLKVLYEDPELGFQVLAHINDKARVSPPHDHGASWAIYGQATHHTDMVEWEREDNGADPGQAGDLAQVHQERRGRPAELHRREQALATGQDAGPTSIRIEPLQRLLHALWFEVFKLLHLPSSFSRKR